MSELHEAISEATDGLIFDWRVRQRLIDRIVPIIEAEVDRRHAQRIALGRMAGTITDHTRTP